jgi:hypothetical protein
VEWGDLLLQLLLLLRLLLLLLLLLLRLLLLLLRLLLLLLWLLRRLRRLLRGVAVELGEEAPDVGLRGPSIRWVWGRSLAAAPRQHPGEIRTPSGRKDCLLLQAVHRSSKHLLRTSAQRDGN